MWLCVAAAFVAKEPNVRGLRGRKRLSRNTGMSGYVRVGVDSKSSDEGLRWRHCGSVRMVTKGNFGCFACNPMRTKPAQTGELVIVRDDSGTMQMDRGDRQNRDRNSKHAGYYPGRKMRSTAIYSMVYSNNRRGGRPVKSFER